MKQLVIIILFILSASTVSSLHAQRAFDKEGHRGGRGLMPENTISSMKKAVELGVTLEMDISFTKEKLPIISHDQYINPAFTLKANGDSLTRQEASALRLYNLSYTEIKSFDVGSKFYKQFPHQQKIKEHIPLLSVLIDTVEAYAKAKHLPAPHYNIETKTSPDGDDIKHPAPQEFVDRLMAVLVAKGILKRVIIQSFDPRTLEIVHRQYPAVATAWLVSNQKDLKTNLSALTFKPTIYSPDYKMLNKQVVDDCHSIGIKVIPWTVNDPKDIQAVKALGVDGMISDYPDRF